MTGLRAVACGAVVFDHFWPWPPVPNSIIFNAWRSAVQISPGSMGVIYFFSLSAFLLTYLSVREFDHSGEFRIGRFMMRRCLRIWPLYFTILAAFVLYGLFVKPQFPGQFGKMQGGVGDDWLYQIWIYLLFISNWFYPYYGEMSIVWSIALEEQFYLAFPFLFALGIRSQRVGIAIVASLITLAVAWRLGFVLSGYKRSIYYLTPTYFDVFALGAVAGYLAARQRIPRLFKIPGIGIVIFVGIVFFGWHGHRSLHQINAGTVYVFFAFAVLFSSLTLWIVANRDALFSRFLRLSTMYWLGLFSYGVYMWHLIARDTVMWLLGAPFTGDSRLVFAAIIYPLLAVALAAVTYRFVELPFLRLKTKVGGTYDETDKLLQASVAGMGVLRRADIVRRPP